MNNIILKIFNKPIKLSEATPDQQELVELVIEEWKNLLQEQIDIIYSFLFDFLQEMWYNKYSY